ncbi:hypothetical protein [Bradyrhizobium sp. LMTR 3]|uniref:hypothetical protein n=1 Tax=Bradyrhizobium sp. LMTR 3 TaxID=189873 RepID=UPI001FD91B22|nr:hypothetical protein [Bradyrhizobium sp. LMTR 3]
MRDKFGGEITALTTVDAECCAKPGVQMWRTRLLNLANYGRSKPARFAAPW